MMSTGTDADLTPYFNEAPLYRTQGICVSPDIVELTSGLAGRSPMGPLGHDSCDRWAATRAIIKAAGLNEKWGTCPECDGEGSVWDSPENKAKAEAWEQEEPPEGPGYQLWETVSEGSPVSPVFEEPDALAEWLATSADYSARMGVIPKEQWLKFILGPGWAPSMIISGGRVMSGVEAVTRE